MFEIAVRFKELASSNLNDVVERAASPAKMLRLLLTELEEAVITLQRDATLAERRARDCGDAAKAQDRAAKDWHDKAKLALDKDREDLARGALAEREKALAAAESQRQAGKDAEAERAALREAMAGLESKLAETRQRLLTEMAASKAATASPAAATPAAKTNAKVDRVTDRIATLEKRIDFAEAGSPGSKAASLDEELAALQRDARLEAELAALRKSAKKK
jgi:phage shock protein A